MRMYQMFYQMFTTKEEREQWIKEQKKDSNFRLCFRCTAKQLKEDLPFISINGFKSAVVYTFKGE